MKEKLGSLIGLIGLMVSALTLESAAGVLPNKKRTDDIIGTVTDIAKALLDVGEDLGISNEDLITAAMVFAGETKETVNAVLATERGEQPVAPTTKGQTTYY